MRVLQSEHFMPRPKRNSQIIEQAQRRLESLQSIDPYLDFGYEVSVANYTEQIANARQTIAQYNILLSHVDEAQKAVEAAEEKLATLSKQLLLSVGIRYGETSVEYMKAGGKVRSSRRKDISPATGTPSVTPLMTTIISQPTPAIDTRMNRRKSSGTKTVKTKG
jgi:hypothetical protein